MTPKSPVEKATQFGIDYRPEIEALGYSLMSGLNVKDRPGTIDAIILPKETSPNPIDSNLLTRIKDQILPTNYDGLPVHVEYDPNPIELQ